MRSTLNDVWARRRFAPCPFPISTKIPTVKRSTRRTSKRLSSSFDCNVPILRVVFACTATDFVLLALQLESDEPEYDMDEIDHRWFAKTGRALCPELTHLDYETIVDKLENASTRTLVSLDEARALFASSIPIISNDLHIRTVYDVWHERRTIRVHCSRVQLVSFRGRTTRLVRTIAFQLILTEFCLLSDVIRTND